MACLIALGLAGVLATRMHRFAGTTLAAPAVWAVIAAAAIALVELLLAIRGPATSEFAATAWRYAAGCGALMPFVAVLGAKRPQDRGWQWVVFSLWITLLVPVGQAVAARASGGFELPTFWRGVVIVLIGMELLNYLPTRQWLAVIVAASGQGLLVYSNCMSASLPSPENWTATSMILLMCAVVSAEGFHLARIRGARLVNAADVAQGQRLSHRWLEFRDAFGAFWGLRVMQRLNQSAELAHLPARLEWSGWRAMDGVESFDDALPQIEQAMDAVLWRFERRAATEAAPTKSART